MKAKNIGNGDRCPGRESHGAMNVQPSGKQWCPNQEHDRGQCGPALYESDGVTPARRGTPSR